MYDNQADQMQGLKGFAGLKVNNQQVAYATRFSAVRLKNCVVAPPRLKSQSTVRLL